MPGMIHLFPIKHKGELRSAWMCDKCRNVFAFDNNEKLYCPKCKTDGYPMNLDPGEGESSLIVTP
jgi:rubrerythrin